MLRIDQGTAPRTRAVLSALALSILAACAVPGSPAGEPVPDQGTGPAYDWFNLERAVRDSQRMIDRIDATSNGAPSFQRLIADASAMLDARTADRERITGTVVDLMFWQYFFTPSDQHIPPVPLVDTGHQIIGPPPGVHPFYEKYLNAYEDDWTQGIAIISSDRVPDRALRKVEQTVNKLLSYRPDLRAIMSSNNIRVAVRGVAEAHDNSDHPGNIGPGGARPSRPTTYIEEEGVAWRDADGEIHEGWYQLERHVAVEEFGHSIHHSGLPFIDPDHDILAEINAAYVNALETGVYSPPQYLDGPGLTDPSMADALQREIEALDDGEYFAVGLDCFYGVVHENREYTLSTRDEMRERDPMLYEIISRYFPPDEWSPMDYAPEIYDQPTESAVETINVLIIDGVNNHDWESTTAATKATLEQTGRFTVDVSTSPRKRASREEWDAWRPAFSDYQVVLSNFNDDCEQDGGCESLWSEATKSDLEAYVRGGGGFVSVHAADNHDANWLEYNKMIGVGGWGGREAGVHGSILRNVDGAWIATSPDEGISGEHGAQRSFLIVHDQPEHPILAGLPTEWLHATDELYASLRGPAENVEVLAHSHSLYTNEDEPILMVVSYGEGKVFHIPLGHYNDESEPFGESVHCVGFQTVLARGTEYVATGEVTIGVPDSFPGSGEPVVIVPEEVVW